MPLITPRRRFLITAPLALLLPAGLLTYLGLLVVDGVEFRYRESVYDAIDNIKNSVRNRSTDKLQSIITNFQTLFESQILDTLPPDENLEEYQFQLHSSIPFAQQIFIYNKQTSSFVFYKRHQNPEQSEPVWTPTDEVPEFFRNQLKSAIDLELDQFINLQHRPEYHYLSYPDMSDPENIYSQETYRALANYEIFTGNADSQTPPFWVYGFTFDFDFLNGTFFPELISEMWTREGELKYPIAIEDRKTNTRITNTSLGGGNEAEFSPSTVHYPQVFNDKFPWYMLYFSDETGGDIMEIAAYEKIVYYCLIAAANIIMIVGVFGALRNISKELAISDMRSDFVARVSHELRTPLGLIRLYAETLEMGRTKDDNKKKEYLKSIIKESERLTALINNILNFSQIEAETKHYTFVETHVDDVVQESVETMRYHLERHGFELGVDVAERIPAISCDPEAIQQALYNLLSNAMKYSGEGKRIEVRAYPQDGEVVIEVKDYGIGIASVHQRKIFQEFYRVDDPRVRQTGGSGLGLALVKHIVESHGGKLLVSSVPGKGSTFYIHLPIQRPEDE